MESSKKVQTNLFAGQEPRPQAWRWDVWTRSGKEELGHGGAALPYRHCQASPVAQRQGHRQAEGVRAKSFSRVRLFAKQEMWLQSLGRKITKEMTPHSSILDRENLQDEEKPGGLQSRGSQESDMA